MMKTIVLIVASLFLAVPSVSAESGSDGESDDWECGPGLFPITKCVLLTAFDMSDAPAEVREPVKSTVNTTIDTFWAAYDTAQETTCFVLYGSEGNC